MEASGQAGGVRPETERIDQERRHLEGLLKDRINFYLVFASVFMLGLSRIEGGYEIKTVALATITIVSLLIALAVLRTHRLVEAALRDIRRDENHPYTRYRATIAFPWNANWILLYVPFILTVFFLAVTIYYFRLAVLNPTS